MTRIDASEYPGLVVLNWQTTNVAQQVAESERDEAREVGFLSAHDFLHSHLLASIADGPGDAPRGAEAALG